MEAKGREDKKKGARVPVSGFRQTVPCLSLVYFHCFVSFSLYFHAKKRQALFYASRIPHTDFRSLLHSCLISRPFSFLLLCRSPLLGRQMSSPPFRGRGGNSRALSLTPAFPGCHSAEGGDEEVGGGGLGFLTLPFPFLLLLFQPISSRNCAAVSFCFLLFRAAISAAAAAKSFFASSFPSSEDQPGNGKEEKEAVGFLLPRGNGVVGSHCFAASGPGPLPTAEYGI